MFLASTRLVIKYFFQNFVRNFWLSVVAITIMVASLFSLTSIIVMSGMAMSLVSDVSQKVDISIYFPPSVSDERVNNYKNEIEKLSETRSVNVITSQEALDQFKEQHKDDDIVLSSLQELDGNPIGPILTIQAKTLNDYPALIESLEKLSITKSAQEVDYKSHEQTIETLKTLNKKVQLLGIILTVFFALIAGLTVVNTIRLGIYSHRDEIGIMKLVGATNAFIRAPYVLEGIFYALIATTISWGIMLAVVKGFSQQLTNFFAGSNFSVYQFLVSDAPSLILAEFILLSFLNILASAIALRKYMQV